MSQVGGKVIFFKPSATFEQQKSQRRAKLYHQVPLSQTSEVFGASSWDVS